MEKMLQQYFRSLAITLILCVFVEPGAHAFAIGTPARAPDHAPPDLSAEESTLLAVKNDLIRRNDLSRKNNKDNHVISKQPEVVPIGEIVVIDISTKSSDSDFIQSQSTTPTIKTTRNERTGMRSSKDERVSISHSNLNKKFRTTTITPKEETTVVYAEYFAPEAYITKANQDWIDENLTTTKEPLNNETKETITTNENIMETSTELNNAYSYPKLSAENTESYIAFTSSLQQHDKKANDTSKQPGTTKREVLASSNATEKRKTTKEIHTTTEQATSTETVVRHSYTISEPPANTPAWKKYTAIERNHPRNTIDDISASNTQNEGVVEIKPHGSIVKRSTISEKASTPKAKSKSEGSTKTTLPVEMSGSTSNIMMKGIDLVETKFTDVASETLGPETISSKRGGFLDLTEKITESIIETITTATERLTTRPTSRPVFSLSSNNVITDNKKATDAETHSHLDEYAIRDELMMERTLTDNIENTIKRQQPKSISEIPELETTPSISELPNLETTPTTGNTQSMGTETTENKRDTTIKDEIVTTTMGTTTVEIISDSTIETKPEFAEDLRVKPIVRPSVYTVNPNYKKMKKIEVAPAKPFLRDPDDNSWRNESLSSLGIVFNANNSSKTFTEVIKNKTETELSNLSLEKETKTDTPALKERLEKLAEERKSKKKKTDKSGESNEGDYEEYGYDSFVHKPAITTDRESLISTEPPGPPTTAKAVVLTTTPAPTTKSNIITTEKPKKLLNILEYFDTGDDDGFDYVTLPQLDLKKYTATEQAMLHTTSPTTTGGYLMTIPMSQFPPDRKPTVQYFPPRETTKTNMDEYDNEFQRKINMYTEQPNMSTNMPQQYNQPSQTSTTRPAEYRRLYNNKQNDIGKNYYSLSGRTTPDTYIGPDEGYNRGTYVIKHFKEVMDEVSRDEDPEYLHEIPASPATTTRGDFMRNNHQSKVKPNPGSDYEYGPLIRKEILERFVDNFHNHDKVDYPVLYNNSVVHQKAEDGGKVLASSRAFLRQVHNKAEVKPATRPSHFLQQIMRCEPPCENPLAIEYSPAYELHYYVPEQEEKQELLT